MTAIRRDVLQLIMEAARDALPNELGGILRAYDGVVTEVLVLPGTEQGAAAAIFRFSNLPHDPSAVGTVHSHPSGVTWPSKADLELFDRFGHVHIICGIPFDLHSWRVYDGRGGPMELDVRR